MKMAEDLLNGLPVPEKGFADAVESALSALPDRERVKVHKIRTAVLLAAVLLVAGVGVAATIERWGVQEFIENSPYANVGEEAVKVLSTNFEDQVIDTPYGRMVITEAYYDGVTVYLAAEVTAAADTMIVPSHVFADNQAFSYGSRYPADCSIDEYATQLGYSKVLAFQSRSDEALGGLFDSWLNEDGSFSIMSWSFVYPEYRMLDELEMHLAVHVFRNNSELGEFGISFTIPLAGEVHCANSRAGEQAVFRGEGITVTEVETIHTPLATYILSYYDVTDASQFQRNKWAIRFLDEHGEELRKGAQPLSIRFDNSLYRMGERTYYITNRLFDGMPEEVTLATFDTDGNIDESYTFHLE